MPTTFYPPYNTGGDAIHVYSLANSLAGMGHQIDIIHCIDSYQFKSKNRQTKIGYKNHPNITVYSLKSRVGDLSPVMSYLTGYPFFKRKLADILQKNTYDLVHFHGVSFFGVKVFRYGSAPKIHTAHTHFLICPQTTMLKYGKASCNKKKFDIHCQICLMRTGKPPQIWRHTKLLEESIKHLGLIIAPSEYLKNKLVSGGIKSKIAVLPHFVQEPSHVKKEYKKDYFLFVGRTDWYKGLQKIMPLFGNIKAELFVIGGEGNYDKQLRVLASGNKKIRFFGRLDNEYLGKFYKNAIATIIPSIVPEVFPMVALESLSYGTPIIVNNVGGLPEIALKSKAGFVFKDDKQLLSALNTVKDDNKLRSYLSKNALRAYKKHFSKKAFFKKYFELIENVKENTAHN
ncbi:glycosyltransferase family 4 protein [Candidatus Woesearchaeota archaeon]|nr:glycosyltransferase family 4 protein [Candidatus Woesearchaeota archaeon]